MPFGQAALDGGMSGWVTAIASVGLLGPVLYWLCYHHLPNKDKQLKEILDAKDQVIERVSEKHEKIVLAMAEKHEAIQHAQGAEFKEALTQILQHCRDESARDREAFKAEISRAAEGKP
jgi:hypothetical protein